VLSGRADLLTGGDALVAITGADPATVRVDLDGRDVTGSFAVRGARGLQGVVTGLPLGRSILTARVPGGRGARVTLTNHPIGGPVFSGPQIQPWYCLPGALDAQCNRATKFTWMYKSTSPLAGGFQAYDPSSPPSDVATTTTDDGRTVPYVVRVETGNMDRSQYRIAVLADPRRPFTRWEGPRVWNHKVYVPHGAGCGMGHSEGAAPDVLLDTALSRGFAVMSTALEHNTENCNVVVQAESVMMAKEHLIETYGDVRYTMGMGCSGGSIAQLQMANAYPGLYDGLTVGCTYPDIPVNDLLDCPALMRYWDDPTRWRPGVVWTEAQQAAAAGLASTSVCRAWTTAPPAGTPAGEAEGFSLMFDPRRGVACDVTDKEPEAVYDLRAKPTGVRCTFQDTLVNIFGHRPRDRWGPVERKIGEGFANRPYDNVGVQYGLRALLARDITPAQFADLNAALGAVDIDYGTQAARGEADPAAISAAYRSGVRNEAGHLDRVPIIDLPSAGDRYEIHDNYKSWDLRTRLDNANGHHDNHVIWYGPFNDTINPLNDVASPTVFMTMDKWLSAIERDRRDLPLERKVALNRPKEAVDRCELVDRTLCDVVAAPAGNIRWASGGPTLANDIIKCTLKPLRRSDYHPIVFTDDDWDRLQDAFHDGVCDWTKPGVDQQPTVAWQTYQDAEGSVIHGGTRMPAPPVSHHFKRARKKCASRRRPRIPTRGRRLTSRRTHATCAPRRKT